MFFSCSKKAKELTSLMAENIMKNNRIMQKSFLQNKQAFSNIDQGIIKYHFE